VKLSKAQLRGGPFKAGYRVHELPYRRGLNEGTPHCDPWRNPYLQRGVPAGGDAELSQVPCARLFLWRMHALAFTHVLWMRFHFLLNLSKLFPSPSCSMLRAPCFAVYSGCFYSNQSITPPTCTGPHLSGQSTPRALLHRSGGQHVNRFTKRIV